MGDNQTPQEHSTPSHTNETDCPFSLLSLDPTPALVLEHSTPLPTLKLTRMASQRSSWIHPNLPFRTPKETEGRHVPFTIQLYQFPFSESPPLSTVDMGKTGSSIYFFLPKYTESTTDGKMETPTLPCPPNCPTCVMGTYTNTLNPKSSLLFLF